MDINIWFAIIAVFVGALSIYGSSLFVEWILVKHIMDNPAHGLLISITIPFAAGILYQAFTGGLELLSFVIGIPAYLLALLFGLPSYKKRKMSFEAATQD